MQFSLPVKMYSAPINLQEVTYTVSGTLLIDTNISMFRAFCAAYAMGGLTFLEAGNISLVTGLFENLGEIFLNNIKSYFRTNMMFHNDNLSMLSAENYAYCRI